MSEKEPDSPCAPAKSSKIIRLKLFDGMERIVQPDEIYPKSQNVDRCKKLKKMKKNEKGELKAKNKDLKSNLKSSSETIVQLKKEQKDAEKSVEEYSEKIISMAVNNEKLKEQVALMDEEIEDLKIKLAAAKEEKDRWKKEAEVRSEELSSSKIEVNETITELDKANKELTVKMRIINNIKKFFDQGVVFNRTSEAFLQSSNQRKRALTENNAENPLSKICRKENTFGI